MDVEPLTVGRSAAEDGDEEHAAAAAQQNRLAVGELEEGRHEDQVKKRWPPPLLGVACRLIHEVLIAVGAYLVVAAAVRGDGEAEKDKVFHRAEDHGQVAERVRHGLLRQGGAVDGEAGDVRRRGGPEGHPDEELAAPRETLGGAGVLVRTDVARGGR